MKLWFITLEKYIFVTFDYLNEFQHKIRYSGSLSRLSVKFLKRICTSNTLNRHRVSSTPFCNVALRHCVHRELSTLQSTTMSHFANVQCCRSSYPLTSTETCTVSFQDATTSSLFTYFTLQVMLSRSSNSWRASWDWLFTLWLLSFPTAPLLENSYHPWKRS